ncbi:hypothetical protein BJV82DRAFT_669085 [Fennellomyces sp. T-0311]|nr:hypothetical protein BJV82DRAFT_669085 [Fennellomyces sp. T-0311]
MASPSRPQNNPTCSKTRHSPSAKPLNSFKDNHESADAARNVDIVASSPYEILSRIFSYIPIETAYQCVQVSRTWRNTLLQCPDPWHTIHSSSILHKLPVSHHVHALFLTGVPSQLTNDIHLLQTRNFSHLKSLSVHIQYLMVKGLLVRLNGKYDIDTICERLYDALSNVPQLTELVVERRFEKPGISLKRILSACPNLTTLKITGYNVIDRVLSRTTQLTNVYLSIDDLTISLHDLEPIFRNSPHLRDFALDCNVEDSIIPVIGSHCPNLSRIITNQDCFVGYYTKAIQVRLQDGHKADRLHCLVLHYLFSPLPLLARFQHCQDTLRTLCLAPVDGAPFHAWHQFASFTLPNLTYLQINTENKPMHFIRTHLPTMLLANASIETLVLQEFYDYSDGVDTAAIYNAIARLPRLTCLRLLRFGIGGDAFLRLLEQSSCLRELDIHSCNGCVSDVLFRIATISQLEQLAIHDLNFDLNIQEFDDFLLLAAQHLVQLTRLSLGTMLFGDSGVQIVASFKSLNHLTLLRRNVQSMVSDERIRLLRRHIKNVQILD